MAGAGVPKHRQGRERSRQGLWHSGRAGRGAGEPWRCLSKPAKVSWITQHCWLGEKNHHYPHFTGEEAKVGRGGHDFPRLAALSNGRAVTP